MSKKHRRQVEPKVGVMLKAIRRARQRPDITMADPFAWEDQDAVNKIPRSEIVRTYNQLYDLDAYDEEFTKQYSKSQEHPQ